MANDNTYSESCQKDRAALVMTWDWIMAETRKDENLACPVCESSGDHQEDCWAPWVRHRLTGGDFTYAPTDLEDCGE